RSSFGRVKQTRIAVGIEAVAGSDCVRISPLHGVEAAESRDQHKQRRARQMEICQQQIDDVKFVPWRDEDRSLPRKSLYAAIFTNGAFKWPQRGRPHRHDPSTLGPGGINGPRGLS